MICFEYSCLWTDRRQADRSRRRTAGIIRGLVEMLTRKQYELLRFINERLKEAGVPPSFDEMKDALDLRSKSGIHRLITALEERGFIRRLPNRARAIEVIKLPEMARTAAAAGAVSRRASSRATSARSAARAAARRMTASVRSPFR